MSATLIRKTARSSAADASAFVASWDSSSCALRRASSARASSMSSARSAASARIVTLSGSTSMKPPATKMCSSLLPLRTITDPVRSGVSIGMCRGSTPNSPAIPGATTKSASPVCVTPSAVTTSTWSFATTQSP